MLFWGTQMPTYETSRWVIDGKKPQQWIVVYMVGEGLQQKVRKKYKKWLNDC